MIAGQHAFASKHASSLKRTAKFFLFSTAQLQTRWPWRKFANHFTASSVTSTLTSTQTNAARRRFFTRGSKLLVVGGANGKIDIGEAEAIIAKQPELHSQKPRVISITQATEFGTLYTRDEIAAISEFARGRGLLLHMDGARFANAIATLNCHPKEITWKLGVDVLCFGGTKNGVGAGELVIFFKKELAREFDYRVKQGGQFGSKMRFLAAPWTALLTDDVWLRNAGRANAAARKLAEGLKNKAKIDAVFPVEANAVFVRMREDVVRILHARGWNFYKFIEPDVYRLMCSWSTTDNDIDRLIRDLSVL